MSDGSTWSVRAAERRRRAVLVAAVLVALARLPRDRRFQEHVLTLAVVLAAAVAIGRENQARALARLITWDERQYQRYLSTLKKV
jgi:hypothetical protein